MKTELVSSEIEQMRAKLLEKPEPPVIKIEDGMLQLDRENSIKAGVTFGYSSPNVTISMLTALVGLDKEAGIKQNQVSVANRYLAMMQGTEPKDQIEAMLTSQMIAAYEISMKTCGKLENCEYLEQYNSFSNTLNKTMRTFAALTEALARYRTKGQQKVIVEHVTVNEGGQAIVGNVNAGGRGHGGNT